VESKRHTADASELLRNSKDAQFNFRWPLAIDQRLEALVDRANANGAATSRKELAAALILACEENGEELDGYVRQFRTTSVGDALLDTGTVGDMIDFASRRPGPRSTK